MLIEFEFEPHSTLYDMINAGIERGYILEGDNDLQSLHKLKHLDERIDEDMKKLNDELNQQHKKKLKGTTRVNFT